MSKPLKAEGFKESDFRIIEPTIEDKEDMKTCDMVYRCLNNFSVFSDRNKDIVETKAYHTNLKIKSV